MNDLKVPRRGQQTPREPRQEQRRRVAGRGSQNHVHLTGGPCEQQVTARVERAAVERLKLRMIIYGCVQSAHRRMLLEDLPDVRPEGAEVMLGLGLRDRGEQVGTDLDQ
ncbi:hypothetical protein [Frankia gtarii]|uniref:hypothetical protein n=1 Tax=Frankia gtarii TaxID=2950102 RepID=UPI0021BEB7E7|nr:hypothetical protein [Frankia gtarii]